MFVRWWSEFPKLKPSHKFYKLSVFDRKAWKTEKDWCKRTSYQMRHFLWRRLSNGIVQILRNRTNRGSLAARAGKSISAKTVEASERVAARAVVQARRRLETFVQVIFAPLSDETSLAYTAHFITGFRARRPVLAWVVFTGTDAKVVFTQSSWKQDKTIVIGKSINSWY